jgi:acetylornithine deacetylase/succinyl-diaminopimelate desuccinylase-like protein
MVNSDTLAQIDRHIEQNLDRTIAILARLCAQPSVSAQHLGIDECARLVAAILREEGFEAEVIPSAGHPVVVGRGDGRNPQTLLMYLHYDVQPAEPLELWESPPFELTRRGNRLYARGISDDKGHIAARLAALAAVRHVLGVLPCQVKFVIEGEEEIGSPNMQRFVEDHQELLASDACIWEFGGVNVYGDPEMTLGMRGICYVELAVSTASRDAHSGLAGSIFPNAAWRLVQALHTLRDANGRILIEGHYDNVRPPSPRDLEYLDGAPDESAVIRDMYRLESYLGAQSGLDWKVQAVFEPTCTICGLTSGYQGPGTKTVLPATATAKVDFRLVPDQTPEEVVSKLRAHLDRHGFEDVEVALLGGQRPAKVDPDDPFVQLSIAAARDVYDTEIVVLPIIGGSGPLYPFVSVLGVPVVSAGIGHPDSRVHAPNENIDLDYFLKGIKHTARIVAAFGEQGSGMSPGANPGTGNQ